MGSLDSRLDTPTQGGSGRRLKAGERERQIYLEAAKLFAERGFEAGTPELADRLGVAQLCCTVTFAIRTILYRRSTAERMRVTRSGRPGKHGR